MLDAMGDGYSNGHGQRPTTQTKAQYKAFVPLRNWAWSGCDCKGVPGAQGRGDYFVIGSENCPTHAHVKGNFNDDSIDA